MTFYNLPDTDVKIEYDKGTNMLRILNLPEHVYIAPLQYTGQNVGTVAINWKPCECCNRVEVASFPNGNHKMSCNYGEHFKNKITAPVSMLQKYPPNLQDEVDG